MTVAVMTWDKSGEEAPGQNGILWLLHRCLGYGRIDHLTLLHRLGVGILAPDWFLLCLPIPPCHLAL